eukprot:765046-Hanusia_phi.AAC.1
MEEEEDGTDDGAGHLSRRLRSLMWRCSPRRQSCKLGLVRRRRRRRGNDVVQVLNHLGNLKLTSFSCAKKLQDIRKKKQLNGRKSAISSAGGDGGRRRRAKRLREEEADTASMEARVVTGQADGQRRAVRVHSRLVSLPVSLLLLISVRWGIGCCAFEFATGDPPFVEENRRGNCQALLFFLLAPRPSYPSLLSSLTHVLLRLSSTFPPSRHPPSVPAPSLPRSPPPPPSLYHLPLGSRAFLAPDARCAQAAAL